VPRTLAVVASATLFIGLAGAPAAKAGSMMTDRHVGWVNQIGAGSWSEPSRLGGPVGAVSARSGSAFTTAAYQPSGKPATTPASKKKTGHKAKKPGGYVPKSAYQAPKPKKTSVKVAALGPTPYSSPEPKPSVTGGGIRWVASASCLAGSLKSVVYQVAANYGSVTVSSTCRSKSRNRRVGGAGKSYHLSGNAVDFRVHGNVGATYAFLKSSGSVGGVKHYGGGRFHIDTGPRRSW